MASSTRPCCKRARPLASVSLNSSFCSGGGVFEGSCNAPKAVAAIATRMVPIRRADLITVPLKKSCASIQSDLDGLLIWLTRRQPACNEREARSNCCLARHKKKQALSSFTRWDRSRGVERVRREIRSRFFEAGLAVRRYLVIGNQPLERAFSA